MGDQGSLRLVARPPAAAVQAQAPALTRVPALDGLRTLAIGVVVALHGHLGPFAGGEIGVDLFLVLSGYLITALLLAERAATGSIHVGAFYVRRALRLYPALLVLLAVLVATAVLVDSGDQFEITGKLLLSCGVAAVYLTDLAVGWHLWDGFHDDAPLLHTWSLSVEEHFYLLWAPLLAVLLKRTSLVRVRRLLLVATAAMMAWTALLAGVLSADRARLVYAPDTRSLGLLIGCLLAVTAATARRPLRLPAAVPWLATGAFVALATVDLLTDGAGRGYLLVVDLLAAAMILGAIDRESAYSRFWSAPALTAIGVRAYGIYLWHFPVFHFLSTTRLPGWGEVELDLARLVVTALLVEVSYRVVELPALAMRHRFTPARSQLRRVEG
ncbi:acyltransferase [Nocardioides sp.]|uniref:acyltransferase family protein n=1 Tax=Nocardioides sp. TaxID=35761 RepID=UPI002EDB9929